MDVLDGIQCYEDVNIVDDDNDDEIQQQQQPKDKDIFFLLKKHKIIPQTCEVELSDDIPIENKLNNLKRILLSSKSSDETDKSLLAVLENTHSEWLGLTEKCKSGELKCEDAAMKMLDLEGRFEQLKHFHIEQKYQEKQLLLVELGHQLKTRQLFLVEKDDGNKELEYSSCLRLLHDSRGLLTFGIRSKEIIKNKTCFSSDCQVNPFWFRQLEEDLPDDVLLYLHCLREFQLRNFRRKKEMVYEEIVSSTGFATHAWKLSMSMSDFVHMVCQKEIRFDMWQKLRNGPNLKRITEKLSKCHEKELIDLEPDRTITSWKNCIYFASRDEFVLYTSEEYSKIPHDIVSCKYFDCDLETMDREQVPSSINTPIHSLLEFQGFGKKSIQAVLALCGRCIYEVRMMDHFECMPYFLGPAGTGKSTIISAVMMMFEDSDVGVAGSDMEPKFGLSGLRKMFLFVATDLRGKSNLTAAQFQSMCTGEMINIPIKYEKAESSKDWKVPGILAGNALPDTWVDNQGSLARRIVLIIFKKVPQKRDREIIHQIEKMYGQVYRAMNVAYLNLLERAKEGDVWSVLPKRFVEAKNIVKCHKNPIQTFLQDHDFCVYGQDKYCPYDQFIQSFRAYCKPRGVRVKIDEELCNATLKEMDCIVKHNTEMMWPIGSHSTQVGTWITGAYFTLDKEESIFKNPFSKKRKVRE